MIYLGSHCSMSAPKYLEGSVLEALSYGANALMVYTGPPQNTMRKNISALRADEAKQLLNEHGLKIEHMIVHAPYIINPANCVNPNTIELAKEFLRKEIDRVQEIGATYLVLHPGSHTTATVEEGLSQIVHTLNEVLKEDDHIVICLETMAGKGSEIGKSFEQLQEIISRVSLSSKLGICLDTCHVHDAGMDVNDIDGLLQKFEEVIGLEKLKVIHVNDSKNVQGAKKDRHENLGQGHIGFDALYRVVHHEKLKHVIKILETPYIDGQPPYKEEIASLLNK